MMPITLANIGEENIILRVGGTPEVRQHLADMGFVAGGTATVINTLNGGIVSSRACGRIIFYPTSYAMFGNGLTGVSFIII